MVRHLAIAEFGGSPVRRRALEKIHRDSAGVGVIVYAGAVTACSESECPLLASVPRVKIVRVSTSGAPAGNAAHEQAAIAATCCRILRSPAIKEST